MTINLITLGCSKNLVDSEKLAFQLKKNGHKVIHNAESFTDGVILNTCGFILDAKTESIESILNYTDAKKQGFVDKVAIMGCLSERYKASLKEEIPEVDAFFGVNEIKEIVSFFSGRYYADLLHERINYTPKHYSYLKISEGCSRKCAFCAIPSIRGRQVSIPIESLVKEAKNLVQKGTRELILIAQELTSYGLDIYKTKALPQLLEELVKIDDLEWIRLHYAYPDNYPVEEIIELMKLYPQICRYLDIPIQHASEKILKRMKRGHTKREIEYIINTFRKEIPEVSIRTTVITGFPGETDADYLELKEFIKQTQFDRMGVFKYSHEEGTPAFDLDDDVPEDTREERMNELMSIQEKISLSANLAKVGKSLKVLVDRKEGEFYIARTEFDSPEVDNEVLIPAGDTKLHPGNFYKVEIFDALEFDLYGRPVE